MTSALGASGSNRETITTGPRLRRQTEICQLARKGPITAHDQRSKRQGDSRDPVSDLQATNLRDLTGGGLVRNVRNVLLASPGTQQIERILIRQSGLPNGVPAAPKPTGFPGNNNFKQ